eukprot:TRINITY_DN38741_c0_g1_i1.p1 TRINITY_DN38741_c0_g1~~TRINITY_DN38741_c0_g1_i1.p1  ORF type:complete len:257 (+),score=48.39 TRINITY_DN38741_c0_g1_i1:46-816(+)
MAHRSGRLPSFEPLLRASSSFASEARAGSAHSTPAVPKARSASTKQVAPPAPLTSSLTARSLHSERPSSPTASLHAERQLAEQDDEKAISEEVAWRLQEGEVLFDMLDRDRDGLLSRREARAWLRSLGWCLTDAGLDMLLKEHSGEKSTWALPQLLRVADLGQDLCGPDPEALRDCFQTLGVQGPAASKELFKQLAVGHEGGLTELDVEDLFTLCGVPAMQRSVGLDTLVDGLVGTICQPKVNVHKGAWGSRRLFV